jgi:hypothetical protein
MPNKLPFLTNAFKKNKAKKIIKYQGKHQLEHYLYKLGLLLNNDILTGNFKALNLRELLQQFCESH